jgi:Sensors of blue-light using FAD
MQPLHRLTYCSTPKSGLAEPDIRAILRTARGLNSKAHITGFLSFHKSCFLQVLEGSREALTHTFLRIGLDPRHHDVMLMGFEAIDQRAFPSWSMGYLPLVNHKDERIRRYTASGHELRPTDLSVQGAVSLLLEFAQDAAAEA